MRQSRGVSRGAAAALAALVLVTGIVVSTRSDGRSSGGLTVSPLAALAVVLVVGAAVASIRHAFARPSVAELATFSTVYDVRLSPSGVELVERYLARVRRYRWAWFWIAVVGGVAAMLARPPQAGSGDLAGPLATGFSGSFLGAVLAELYNLRPARRDGSRAAVLERRTLASYLPWGERRRVWIAGGMLAMLPAASAATGHLAGTTAFVYVTLAVALVATVEVLQHHVVGRSRPAVDDDLARADDAIREAAIRDGIGRSGFALLLLALAHAFAAMGAGVLSLLCLMAAIGYWRDRPRRAADRPRPSVPRPGEPGDCAGTVVPS